MKHLILLATLVPIACLLSGQNSTAENLLQKSIDYHDPQGKWATYDATLLLAETRPGGADRKTSIHLQNNIGAFQLKQNRGENQILRYISTDSCYHELNGSATISEEDKKQLNLICERTQLVRNYYTYLWGLPMKLRDKGTIVHDQVVTTTFQGKPCLSIKISYQEEVGKDTWYFYFHPSTSALLGYRFFHDESKNDGEYITLDGEVLLQGIRFPKTRKWYVNKDDEFLGADILDNK